MEEGGGGNQGSTNKEFSDRAKREERRVYTGVDLREDSSKQDMEEEVIQYTLKLFIDYS